jgi:hypothetical protein
VQPPYWDKCRMMDFGQLRQFIDDSLKELAVRSGDNHPRSKEDFLNLLEMLHEKISAPGLPKILPDPGDPPLFPKYALSEQLKQQLTPLYTQRVRLRAQLTVAQDILNRKKGRKRRNSTKHSFMKKQVMELKSKLGRIEREITSLRDRERQEYELRRNASPSLRAYKAAKAAQLRSLHQQEGQLRKVSGRLKIFKRVRKDVERAFTFGTVVPTRRLPWRVLPPGELSVSTLHQHYDRLQQLNPRIR